jgi:hypothetical protein
MPAWLAILFQVFNWIGSSGMISLATYGQMQGQPGAKSAAIIAGAGAMVQQLRDNPLSNKAIAEKTKSVSVAETGV